MSSNFINTLYILLFTLALIKAIINPKTSTSYCNLLFQKVLIDTQGEHSLHGKNVQQLASVPGP